MMDDLEVHDTTIDLVYSFFFSSRDALKRSEEFSSDTDESLGVRISHDNERQFVVECAIASFLAVEARLNRIFSDQIKQQKATPFERWLKSRWHFGLQTEDKLALVLNQYASTDFLDFPVLRELFLEMTSFRNTLVHTTPQDYEMLIQPDVSHPSPGSGILVAVAEKGQRYKYPKTGLSCGLWSLRHSDVAKCHEIMVLMLGFLHARFKLKQMLIVDKKPQKGWQVKSLVF
jgi:hypothetical protein